MRTTVRATAMCIAAAAATVAAAQRGGQTVRVIAMAPPADAAAIPLWPEGSLPEPRVQERWGRAVGQVGATKIDQPFVRNVTRPTMTPVLPDPARATGAAVIVAPGGAFQSLSMESEGFDIARKLAARGIAAFVLKYRLNETPADDGAYMERVGRIFAEAARTGARPDLREPRATADALEALRLVRAGAARWGVDPARVGAIGFSAGAMTAMQTVLTAPGGARPAFIGYIYGPMTPVAVPADAPPMFAAIALDDGLFGRQGFGVVDAWRRADRPVELHAYERGDHGFGAGRPGTTSVGVLDQFVAWMDARGLLARGGAK